MEKYVINESDFYKDYSLEELSFIRKRLDLIQCELDKENLEGALSLIMEKPYIDYKEFNFYCINILIRMNKLNLAYEIASDPRFKDFFPIQAQFMGLTKIINQRKKEEEIARIERENKEKQIKAEVQAKKAKEQEKNNRYNANPNNKNKHTNSQETSGRILLTKIYVGVATLDEINQADIDPFKKILLNICYYDKYNHANGVKYIKSIKDQIVDERKRKIISPLRARLENKRNQFFDIAAYSKPLGFSVDFNYANELNEMIKAEEEQRQMEINARNERISQEALEIKRRKEEQKQEERNNRPTSFVFHPVASSSLSPYVSNSKTPASHNLKKVNKVKMEVDEDISPKKLRIKDAFANEANIIGEYLYMLMNVNQTAVYIKQYDNYEKLIEKSVDDIGALEKFESIVIKCSKTRDIKISYEEKSFKKYKKL